MGVSQVFKSASWWSFGPSIPKFRMIKRNPLLQSPFFRDFCARCSLHALCSSSLFSTALPGTTLWQPGTRSVSPPKNVLNSDLMTYKSFWAMAQKKIANRVIWIATHWSRRMEPRGDTNDIKFQINSISGSGIWIRSMDRLGVRGMDREHTFWAAAIKVNISLVSSWFCLFCGCQV